jgi:hypothetical protein
LYKIPPQDFSPSFSMSNSFLFLMMEIVESFKLISIWLRYFGGFILIVCLI